MLTGGTSFSRHHLAVVAVVVAMGLALGAWWARPGTPHGEVVAPSVVDGQLSAADPAADPATGQAEAAASDAARDPGTSASEAQGATRGAAGGAGGPSAPGGSSPASGVGVGTPLVVDVAGRVRRPGIAVLPAGARVVDALKAAGGAKPRVDLSPLNLARPLIDGEQVLVGIKPATVPGVPAGTVLSNPTGGLVSLNTADQPTLETLPGVGPVTAQSILTWRAENGGFTSVEELLEVSGIGEATLARLAPLVTL